MKIIIFIATLIVASLLTVSLGFCARKEPMIPESHYPFVHSVSDVAQLFPKTIEEIQRWTTDYTGQVTDAINALIAIPAAERTFANTAQALDDIGSLSQLGIRGNSIEVIEYVHPDEAMRNAAHESSLKLKDFWIDTISTNKPLYHAFKDYYEGAYKTENLTDEQRYLVEESMKEFKRAGLHLPDDQLAKVKEVKKELMVLSQDFEKNIAESMGKQHITVAREGLDGLDDDFIAALKRTDDGNYILGVDYPTYFNVLRNCRVEQTRKDLYRAFGNVAYPENDILLKKIIAKRDELVHLLGFESYAAYDIENKMAKKVSRVEEFLGGLMERLVPKAQAEIARLTADLPESVSLTEDGLIKPWDLSFILNEYKKKHFAIDERKISEYFPMKQTIDELLDVYRQFLNVEFEVIPSKDFWHEDVQLVQVRTRDGKSLGYLLLDLYPRPGKYSHAAHVTLFPALIRDGDRKIAVSLVMANFPKPTAEKPALLMRSDVNTFFHEFGHAMHAMLGATNLAGLAGTHVKRDFVEMPSQMLEEWLYDNAILKKISHHYKTGEPLPDDIIESVIKLKNFSTGIDLQRQGLLANLSLAYFKPGADKDPYAILKELFETLVYGVQFDPEYHFYVSFGHLTGYGASYYGYLWSKVFALDLFDTIKQHGLLNGEIGQKYIDAVLSKGGSKDPNELLVDFLGRQPNDTAFLRDLGLN